MATTAPDVKPTGEYHLQRKVGLRGMTLVSLGSIIGSGWLFGALGAATLAGGGGSLLTWLIAAAVLGLLALVHAELGSTYPVSGGTARFPFMAFGGLGGFTGGWMAFIQAVTIAPIEVEASLSHLQAKFPTGFVVYNANGTLAGSGVLWGLLFMAFFTLINTLGVRWLAETNSIAMIWKLLIPTTTIFALLFTSFHSGNFTAGGGFAPYGAHGVLAALAAGVIFAAEGFEQSIQIGGETQNPQRNIPRALLIAMGVGTVFYLLLDFAFVGSLNPVNLVHGWAQPIPGVAKLGPYISLTTQAGLGWLATLLVIDAVVSPGGTGLVYMGTSSRLSYGLGRNGYFPKIISKINSRGVPLISIGICFVIGMLTFLPFPDWFGLVGLITSATVIMYAMAPLALAGLRKQDPDRPRAYRLPAAWLLSPLAFIAANIVVYVSGYSTIFWLEMFIAVGFIIFGLYQVSLPADKRTILDLRSATWLVPWLGALLVLSWLGRYDGNPTRVFGLTLVASQRIGNWWDLLAVAAMSLVIYYWATNTAMTADKVQTAVAEVETEASIELDSHLLT
ncbi:MAG TPA: APC family permease [Streptosporangiaceae bacterium]|nr:APC family permease [Streptosporangiaceae bacterium]